MLVEWKPVPLATSYHVTVADPDIYPNASMLGVDVRVNLLVKVLTAGFNKKNIIGVTTARPQHRVIVMTRKEETLHVSLGCTGYTFLRAFFCDTNEVTQKKHF